jgi:putative FmdB family regulatory protein
MPIYAYRCAACGHSRDVLQKLSDAPLTDCPACGAGQFAKQITAAGFQLKGSGWYATDFRNNNSGQAKPASTAAGEGTSAGSDSAPAASPPAAGGDSGSSSASTSPAGAGCGGSCACH